MRDPRCTRKSSFFRFFFLKNHIFEVKVKSCWLRQIEMSQRDNYFDLYEFIYIIQLIRSMGGELIFKSVSNSRNNGNTSVSFSNCFLNIFVPFCFELIHISYWWLIVEWKVWRISPHRNDNDDGGDIVVNDKTSSIFIFFPHTHTESSSSCKRWHIVRFHIKRGLLCVCGVFFFCHWKYNSAA